MIYLRTFAAVLLLLLSWPSAALTAGEFVAICESARKPCVEHPLLQAYVGGALDLIAMLDEQTDYLTPVYCKPPEELFDVSAIIRFVEVHAADNESTNAMLLVIRFLEEQHSDIAARDRPCLQQPYLTVGD